jgi:hypothetical protein
MTESPVETSVVSEKRKDANVKFEDQKTMFNGFFDSRQVIYYESVPPKQTDNPTFCFQILQRLWQCIRIRQHLQTIR